MASITINTNLASLTAQKNLSSATTGMNKAMERLSTGYKINSGKDDAAGSSVSTLMEAQISGYDVAEANAAMGLSLLDTAEGVLDIVGDYLQRIRDLTEQAANGTYGSSSLKAIQSEVVARLQEISRIAANSEFNGIKLMSYTKDGDGTGITKEGINLQVGLYQDPNSVINLDVSLFNDASVKGLFGANTALATNLEKANGAKVNVDDYNKDKGYKAFAAACAGLKVKGDDLILQNEAEYGANKMLAYIDGAIDEISRRTTAIGAAQNRVDSAISAIDVQSQNLTSSLSTLRDTDVAEESSSYIQAQILQQASATLLATANQTPSIALNLI